jgi:hypothetical protein
MLLTHPVAGEAACSVEILVVAVHSCRLGEVLIPARSSVAAFSERPQEALARFAEGRSSRCCSLLLVPGEDALDPEDTAEPAAVGHLQCHSSLLCSMASRSHMDRTGPEAHHHVHTLPRSRRHRSLCSCTACCPQRRIHPARIHCTGSADTVGEEAFGLEAELAG